MSRRRVVILGSTGSVGTNTLDVIRRYPEKFQVVGLACGRDTSKLYEQIREFKPDWVSVGTKDVASRLQSDAKDFRGFIGVGSEGHAELIEQSNPDIVMASMSGTHGLKACLKSIELNVGVLGLANKEVLVMAGTFVQSALQKSRTQLVPVDSEHSAIFQALMGNNRTFVSKLILTASGGPFRTRSKQSFKDITKQEALKHPTWSMGSKITIDSATMMNKGLEFIEAVRLFDVSPNQIEVVIHPESIVHSIVEYVDGSMMAQLGLSDMRIPISLALAYPERLALSWDKPLKLADIGKLHFEEPDLNKFECLKLAIESLQSEAGPVVLNAANEVAVERFLSDGIHFMEIPALVGQALDVFSAKPLKVLDDALELDLEVKAWCQDWTQNRHSISTSF